MDKENLPTVWRRPAPNDRLIQLIEEFYPDHLELVRAALDPALKSNLPPRPSSWDDTVTSFVSSVESEASWKGTILKEHVTGAALLHPDNIPVLKGLGMNYGALAHALRVGAGNGTLTDTSKESLVSVNYIHTSGLRDRFFSLSPTLDDETIIIGSDNGRIQGVSFPGLTPNWTTSIDNDGPITRLSRCVRARDGIRLIAVAVDHAQLLALGHGAVGPIVRFHSPVSSLDIFDHQTAAVGTRDGRLSLVDFVAGKIVRSRRLPRKDTRQSRKLERQFGRYPGAPGDPSCTVTAHNADGKWRVFTTSDRAVRAWTVPGLWRAGTWPLPPTVTDVTINRAYVCGAFDMSNVVIAGGDYETYFVYDPGRGPANGDQPSCWIHDPSVNNYTEHSSAIALSGDEALLCSTHQLRILNVNKLNERYEILDSGLWTAQGGETVATSEGFSNIAVLSRRFDRLSAIRRARAVKVEFNMELARVGFRKW
jgi:hypothetical protein